MPCVARVLPYVPRSASVSRVQLAEQLLERLHALRHEAFALPRRPIAADEQVVRVRDPHFLVVPEHVWRAGVVAQYPAALRRISSDAVADEDELRDRWRQNRMLEQRPQLGGR